MILAREMETERSRAADSPTASLSIGQIMAFHLETEWPPRFGSESRPPGREAVEDDDWPITDGGGGKARGRREEKQKENKKRKKEKHIKNRKCYSARPFFETI